MVLYVLMHFLRRHPASHSQFLTSKIFPRVLQHQKTLNREFTYKSKFGSSTILVQDGPFVSELPLVIRKVNSVFEPYECKANTSARYKSASGTDIHRLIHKEFLKCCSMKDIIMLLTKCTHITPNIAVGAIERICCIKDLPQTDVEGSQSIQLDDVTIDNILTSLVTTVSKSENIYSIMNCIKILVSHNEVYQDQLCDSLLERVMDRNISVKQLCDVVETFGECKDLHKCLENTEKLWIGFTELEKEFDKKDLVRSFQILHHLKNSRRMVLGVLERKIYTLWWQLSPEDVVDIVEALLSHGITSGKTLSVISRWVNTNIHTLTEEIILELVTKFSQMSFSDSQLEKALERYVKVKGIQIKSHTLVATILNHCLLFRLRNTIILDGCTEYFVAHGKELAPMYLKPFLFPLGCLNFNPSNGARFWQEVEDVFAEKFSKMNTEDVLDIMLGCIYLEKHPLNFIDKVFNQYFLERVNGNANSNLLRNKMKLIDTALTIESKAYGGPLLPKDQMAKSLWYDARVRGLINHLRPHLEVLAGGEECISTNVILPNLFTTELYVVDIMLHPKGLRSSILNFNLRTDRNINTALLVHLPEHFTSNGEILIGPQAMRVRHFKVLGFKVVSLKFETLSKLRMHGKELQQYLVDKIKNAEPAKSFE